MLDIVSGYRFEASLPSLLASYFFNRMSSVINSKSAELFVSSCSLELYCFWIIDSWRILYICMILSSKWVVLTSLIVMLLWAFLDNFVEICSSIRARAYSAYGSNVLVLGLIFFACLSKIRYPWLKFSLTNYFLFELKFWFLIFSMLLKNCNLIASLKIIQIIEAAFCLGVS